MKKILFGVVLLFFFCTNVKAEDPGYGISLGLGQGNGGIDILRVGLEKKFSSSWFQNRSGVLSGYFDLSYNRWKGGGDITNGISFSPVFAYYFQTDDPSIVPYIEAGIGAMLIDDYWIAGRNLSSNLLFEDRIRVGVRIKNLEVNFGYMHYSNGTMKIPNQGIDIWIGSLSWYF